MAGPYTCPCTWPYTSIHLYTHYPSSGWESTEASWASLLSSPLSLTSHRWPLRKYILGFQLRESLNKPGQHLHFKRALPLKISSRRVYTPKNRGEKELEVLGREGRRGEGRRNVEGKSVDRQWEEERVGRGGVWTGSGERR